MGAAAPRDISVAILVPCYNEARAIAKVVADFRAALPEADDLCLRQQLDRRHDRGRARRRRGGAHASRCRARAMWCAACSPTSRPTCTCWSTATTPMTPAARPAMVRLLLDEQLDMVSGARVDRRRRRLPARPSARQPGADRHGRARSSAAGVSDMLSGYRVFSRRFVKSFPALAAGFETETEFTVHALELRMPIGEIATAYRERPGGIGLQAAHLFATGCASCAPSSCW